MDSEKRLFLIEFHRNSIDVFYDFQSISDLDKNKISSIEFDLFDYEDEYNQYKVLMLSKENVMNSYKNILYDNLIPYIISDISSSVISNEINIEDKLKLYLSHANIKRMSYFVKKVNEWIKSNLDIDLVLDMINQNGLESLRKIDIEFLKSF